MKTTASNHNLQSIDSRNFDAKLRKNKFKRVADFFNSKHLLCIQNWHEFGCDATSLVCNFSFKQTEPVGSFRTILPISIEFYKQPEIQLFSWSLSISNLFKSLASTDCSYYRQCHKSSSSSKKQTWFGATVKCFQIRWRHFTLSVELQAFQACKSIFFCLSLFFYSIECFLKIN